MRGAHRIKHQSDDMARPRAHAELNSSIPPAWDHQNAKGGHDDAHGDVRHVAGVGLTALKFEAALISGQRPHEPDEHIPERRVGIEAKLALEVVRTELGKVGLVPDNHGRLAEFVEPRRARQDGVEPRYDVLGVLLDEFALWTDSGCSSEGRQTATRQTTEVGGGRGAFLATLPPPPYLRKVFAFA